MSLYIRSEEADRLARELAERTGESLTQTVTVALRERLERTPSKSDDWEERLARIREIQRRVAAAPILEAGSDNELLYDADGLPK